MAVKSDLSEQAFQQQLQECLQHLYDYSFLESHNLALILPGDAVEGDRVEVLREMILQGIERLRPSGIPFHSKAARSYNILNLRYELQQEVLDVAHKLALSHRQFYREHAKAIHMLSRVLWNFSTDSPPQKGNTTPPGTISLESEIQRSHDKATHSRIDLNSLLAAISSDSHSLGANRHICIEFAATEQPIWLEIDRTLLRQALLFMISTVLEAVVPGSTLHLSAEAASDFHRIIFVMNDPALNGTALRARLETQETLTTLVRILKAHIDYGDDPSTVRLSLKIPSNLSALLIIDDNPDLVELFRRYIHDQSYALYAAEDASVAIQTARQIHPNLIILDIMLASQDGLEILQNLKTHISTRDIPILICSVLDARDLALSLGADDFIRKPPGDIDFLRVLARWRA